MRWHIVHELDEDYQHTGAIDVFGLFWVTTNNRLWRLFNYLAS
jgi:hypothetical protein